MDDFDVRYSRPFDVHVWSDHPRIDSVVETVHQSLSDEQQLAIRGRSNNAGRASGTVHLKIVLLDLYVAWKTDPALCIGIAMGNDSYKVKSRYNALHISPRVRDVVHCLEEQNYIDFRAGSYNRTGFSKGNRTSRMRAARRLASLFSELHLEPYELKLHHKQECIVFKEHDVDEYGEPVLKGGRKKSKDIEYDDTPETLKMRSTLNAYNDFLAETYIDIPSLSEPHLTRTKTNGDTQVIPIDQTNKFVRRIFSRGSWEMNGRFYGGWWQQVDKDLRKQISINNEPTVEVDYNGLHVSILSALRDKPVNVGDRYALKKHILSKFTHKEQRNIVKLLVLTAINARDEETTYSAFRNDQPTGKLEKRLKDNELTLLLEAFIDENPHLQEDLCSDMGIKLMNIDGQITDKIITSFTEQRRPILSVHDSYIVGTFDVDHLSKAMTNASKEIVGQDLSFEQTVPGYNDVIRMQRYDRDRYLDSFQETLSLKNKTTQYEERLLRFMDYRKANFSETYWLGKPSNHY